jgi:predicted DNA-binding protein
MSTTTRQSNYRKRIKQQGMVDVRLELPEILRDKVRAIAVSRNRTMKAEIREAIEKHIAI